MYRIVLCLLSFAICQNAEAQVPKDSFTAWNGTSASSSVGYSGNSSRIQTIYYSSNFPTTPIGVVSAIWFRAYDIGNSHDSISLPEVSVSIGNTNASSFKAVGFDSFKIGLNQVFYAATRSFTGMKTRGKWIKFVGTTANFLFDHSQNFIVEVKHDSIAGGLNNYGGFNWMASISSAPTKRTIAAKVNSMDGPTYPVIMDLGLDIVPTNVSELSNIHSIGLFPNPSIDGHFVVSLEFKKAIKTLDISLTDVTGKTVLRKTYGAVGQSFGEEIDASNLPKGMYNVQLVVDKEHLNRMLVIR